MTLAARICETLGSAKAPAFEVDGGWLAWSVLAVEADRLNTALGDCGIGPHTAIGLIGRNRTRPAAALLAILAGDRCFAPINPFQPEPGILGDIARLDLAAVVGEPEDFASGALEALARERGFAALLMDGADRLDIVVRGTRPGSDTGTCAFLMPTSGTTGVPKRIPIRAESLDAALREGQVIGREFGEEPVAAPLQSPLYQYSPLVHISGALAVARCGAEGRRLTLADRFKADEWVAAIARHRHTAAGLPPTMMRMVLDSEPDPQDLSSLVGVWSGSSPLDRTVCATFEQTYGARVLGSYGATEYCGIVANGALTDRERFGDRPGSVGRFRKSVGDARVIDPATGETVVAGEQGVLELRVYRIGPEWMRTSDIVTLDAEDFLYIHGRADDAINRGGFKIVPSVVADVLKQHPMVSDVAVVGVAHDRLGEAPVALVEMKPGRALVPADELMAFARERLVAYQVPTVIKVVAQMPRTPSMKIDKTAVKALF
ncbi:MAG: Acyl-CoA synthetase [Caulobacter sp.]|nr:Acyl-CoA synthetase [Caulobacter sp.]